MWFREGGALASSIGQPPLIISYIILYLSVCKVYLLASYFHTYLLQRNTSGGRRILNGSQKLMERFHFDQVSGRHSKLTLPHSVHRGEEVLITGLRPGVWRSHTPGDHICICQSLSEDLINTEHQSVTLWRTGRKLLHNIHFSNLKTYYWQ